MTLFFVTPDLYFGGAERVMALLMNQFCQDGDTVILAIMNNREAYPIAYHLDENVKMLFISPFRRNSLKHIVAPLRELRNKIRCYEPDVVVSFFPDTATLTYLAGFGMGFPMVYSERNDPKNNVKGFVARVFEYVATRSAKHVVFQSGNVQSMFPARIRRKSSVILNPLNLVNIPNRDSKDVENVIVSVGRLSPQKNHQSLIDAFSLFEKKHSGYKLVIYGEGELRGELENLVVMKGLENKVLMPGTDGKVLDKISHARIFAFSSRFEGLPNALIEAMAIGVPCVTTNFAPGCVTELINHQNNGLIVPCDDPQSMSHALAYLADNEQKAEEMGDKAKTIREKVDLAKVSRQWKEVFEQIKMQK